MKKIGIFYVMYFRCVVNLIYLNVACVIDFFFIDFLFIKTMGLGEC